jgi:peptide/nickel transport system ATP-binding protein
VLEMMRTLREQMNTSVILITHDFGVVADFCESVAVTYAGEIVEKGSVDRIFNNAQHPYTQGLFGSLPSLDSKERRLKPIKGLMPDPTKVQKGCVFCDRCPHATEQCAAVKPTPVETEPGHFVKCSLVKGAEQ